MALGWGLWEGPARFYFWRQVPITINALQSLTNAQLPLTFKGCGIIYGTDDEPPSFSATQNGGASDHRVRFATVGAFCKLHTVAFFRVLKGVSP